MKKRFYLLSFFLLLTCLSVKAEDGHRLWLRYEPIKNNHLYTTYRHTLHQLIFPGTSPILMAAKEELQNGLDGMLNLKQTENNLLVAGQTLVIGTPATSK